MHIADLSAFGGYSLYSPYFVKIHYRPYGCYDVQAQLLIEGIVLLMISTDELEQYMQQRVEQDAFSGVVLITQGNSQLFAGSYGYASRSWKVPNTLTTRFDTASVTKLFTAVATLQLIDRGLLTFDTPVIDFLGLQGTAISHEVNVFHLLTHTSGIADDVEEESGEGVYRISGRPDPTTRLSRPLTFFFNLRISLPISRLARDAATVIAAFFCWA